MTQTASAILDMDERAFGWAYCAAADFGENHFATALKFQIAPSKIYCQVRELDAGEAWAANVTWTIVAVGVVCSLPPCRHL